MKIIILDRCTVTNGDVDLTPIEKVGEVEYYDILSKEEIIKVAAGADAIICNKAVIDAEIMAKTGVKFVGLFATGYNNIDTEYAHKNGVTVCNVPGYSTDSVAQLTFSLLLELASSTYKYVESTARGDWRKSKQFSYFSFPLTEIAGKTLGIYGLGTIGIAVAKIALAFNMRVIAYTRTPKCIEGVENVSAEELFRESDFLTLHCPLNNETKLIVNERTLSLMKPTAYLINTSRGGTIDEKALCDALNHGVIRGAALDVLTIEPMSDDCPLIEAKNCIFTPHIAWASLEARTRLITKVCENLEAFKQGKPINVV